jgi:hypothetical protein
MLTATYSECHIKAPYAECPYVECHYAERRYADCCYAECHGASAFYGLNNLKKF